MSFEKVLLFLFGVIPKRYGKRVKTGKYYDTYHNAETNKIFVLEKATNKFFER